MRPCPGCGLKEGAGICRSLFHQLTARGLSDLRYGRFHRCAVDAYCLQHPDDYCASAKSLMAHLGGLCCRFEFGDDPAVHKALLRSLNGAPALQKPAIPAFRGDVTIEPVLAANPAAYSAEVERWTRCAWDAYGELHSFARAWIQKTLGSR